MSQSDQTKVSEGKKKSKIDAYGWFCILCVVLGLIVFPYNDSDKDKAKEKDDMEIYEPEIVIAGNRAEMYYKVNPVYPALFHASKINTAVYNAAKKNKEIKSAKVTLELIANLVDQYGYEIKGPHIMGQLYFDDMDDVRKYKDALNYNDTGRISNLGNDLMHKNIGNRLKYKF